MCNMDTCCICLESIQQTCNVKQLTCNHTLHADCFKNYALYCKTNEQVIKCPLCLSIQIDFIEVPSKINITRTCFCLFVLLGMLSFWALLFQKH